MLNAVQAKSISDAQTGGGAIDPVLLQEALTGRHIMDEANHAILWAATKGRYTAYIPISQYQNNVIDDAVADLITLGYNVDESRKTSYFELVFTWS